MAKKLGHAFLYALIFEGDMFMFLKLKANTKVIENFEGASIILFREKSILKKDCNKSGLYVLMFFYNIFMKDKKSIR